MSLKTFVKVGSITNLTDARYCAGMGVDMLGFRAVEGQQNYVKPSQFQEIRGWITGPLIVAEIYGIASSDDLTAILDNYKPDYLALGTRELAMLPAVPLPFLLSVENAISVDSISPTPAYLISKISFKTSIPLLIEVEAKTDAISLINNPQVKGLVLQGGTELKPGLKDLEAMHDILEFLEED